MPGQHNGQSPTVQGETDLTRELTQRLENLRIEKEHLERALEGESIPKLHRQLSLLLQEQQQRSAQTAQQAQRTYSTSSPPVAASPPISLSPNLHQSSSSPTFSTALLSTSASSVGEATDPFSQALINSLRAENNELRREQQRQSRVTRIQQMELVELRRRCGISVEELEDDGSGGEAGDPLPGRSRTRGESSTSGAMRIPGASLGSTSTSSVSPRDRGYTGRRRSSSSLTTSTRASTNGSGSSFATTFTTPSSSYPNTQVPHPTPIGSYASPPPTTVNLPPLNSQINSFRNFAPNFLALTTQQYRSGMPTMALNEEDLLPSPPFTSGANGSFSRDVDDELEDGETTPLSISPGSRSGSLSRRASVGQSTSAGGPGALRLGR